MKILHTADIHIKEYGDERWNVLKTLIEIGEKENIALFIISGDLFDKGVNAENLRVKIRNLFTGTGFKICIIPGNHDRDAYKPGLFFGGETKILGEEAYDIDNIRIIGLPFAEIEGEELLQKVNSLRAKLKDDGINILLFHGELLDTFFSRSDFGEEGSKRYMPVKKSYFDGLDIDYILAGHFHTHFDVYKLNKGGYFVYPGSPISITKKETGRRVVNIFEVGGPPAEYPLITPYYEKIVIELDPFEKKDPIKKIEEGLKAIEENAKVLLHIKGYFNAKCIGLEETALYEKIMKAVKTRCSEEPLLEFRDIHTILEDDLFKTFLKKLNGKNLDDVLKKEMRDTAIKAMMEVRS